MISRFCGVRAGCLEHFMLYLHSAVLPSPGFSVLVVPVLILISHADTSALTCCLSHSVLSFFLLIRRNPHYYLQAVIPPCNHCCTAARINRHIVWTLINYGLFTNGLCPFSAPPPSFSALCCTCTASLFSSL